MTDPVSHVDGNTLAGPLSDVFAVEVGAAIAVCDGCGWAGRLAAAPVYGAPMGLIARCPGCDTVLLRYGNTPTGVIVDMRGIAALRLAPADRG